MAGVIDKLICKIKGHKRGKRVSDTHVECPRCKTPWARAKAAVKVPA